MLYQPINNTEANHKNIISLFSKDSYDELELKCTPATQLSAEDSRQIDILFKATYNDCRPEDRQGEQLCLQNTFVYRLYNNDRLIGTRKTSIIEDAHSAPPWINEITNLDFRGYIAVGNRAMKHPDYHNTGIGTFLINKINHDVFTDRGQKLFLAHQPVLEQYHSTRVWEPEYGLKTLTDYPCKVIYSRKLKFLSICQAINY
jgi:hypothetical protein